MRTSRLFIAALLFAIMVCVPALSQEREDLRGDAGYAICANDLLEISVYDEKELSKVVRVSSDGTIAYPLIGNIEVVGLTAREMEDKLTELLEKDYLWDPQVSVFIKEYAKVSVLGQVKRPGAYELRSGMTVVDAIAMAGGFTDIASGNGTKVIRVRGKDKQVIQVPVESILRGSKSSGDVVLEPNDTVVVPESFF